MGQIITINTNIIGKVSYKAIGVYVNLLEFVDTDGYIDYKFIKEVGETSKPIMELIKQEVLIKQECEGRIRWIIL